MPGPKINKSKADVVSRADYKQAVEKERTKLYKQVIVMTIISGLLAFGAYYTVLNQKPIA